MKYCKKCDTEKPKTEFGKDSKSKCGLRSICKACSCADSVLYRSKNKIKISESNKIYYSNNKPRSAERVKAHRLANPESGAAIERVRRTRKVVSGGNHTAADVLRIFTKQRGFCASCEIRLFKSGKRKFHVDHIMPLALGGSNWPSNLQCLCPTCNLRKGAKDPLDWAKENGRLF